MWGSPPTQGKLRPPYEVGFVYASLLVNGVERFIIGDADKIDTRPNYG
jgi:hypothetical protein